MATSEAVIQVTRWTGGQHPTLSTITRLMQKEGLQPYKWLAQPNQRHAVRSHGYSKVLYVIEGSIEITLPDSQQRMKLRTGDRVDIPARMRHGNVVGQSGAICLEAAVRKQARR